MVKGRTVTPLSAVTNVYLLKLVMLVLLWLACFCLTSDLLAQLPLLVIPCIQWDYSLAYFTAVTQRWLFLLSIAQPSVEKTNIETNGALNGCF